MDTLYKNKLLVWATIVLLVINIVTLATFWITSQGHERNNGRGKLKNGRIDKNILINELNLTDEQVKFYLDSKKKHFKEIRCLRDKIDNNHRLIREELFGKNPDTIRMNNLADSIGFLNAQFEKANFNHFYTLKSRLTIDQCQKFRKIMDEASIKNDQDNRRKQP